MSKVKKIEMPFSAHWLVPPDAKAAWGARLLFSGMVVLNDRQGFHNWDSDEGRALKRWLNQEGALKKALAEARRLAKNYRLSPDDSHEVALYEDDKGKIVGTANASYGYLYTAAWLKSAANEEAA